MGIPVMRISMVWIRVVSVGSVRDDRPVQFIVQGILGFGELFHGLPHPTREFRKFFRTEQKEDNNEDDEHIRAGEVSEKSKQGISGHSFVAFLFVALGWPCRNGRFPPFAEFLSLSISRH